MYFQLLSDGFVEIRVIWSSRSHDITPLLSQVSKRDEESRTLEENILDLSPIGSFQDNVESQVPAALKTLGLAPTIS